MANAPDNSPYLLTSPDPALSQSRNLTATGGLIFFPGSAQGEASVETTGNLAALSSLSGTGYLSYRGVGNFGIRRMTGSATIQITGGDGETGNTIFNVISESSTQRINVLVDDEIVGTRANVNFKSGSGMVITGEDAGGPNQINLTFTASGGGGGGGAPTDAPYWISTDNPDLPNAVVMDNLSTGSGTGLIGITTSGVPSYLAYPNTGTQQLLLANGTGAAAWTATPLLGSLGGTGITTALKGSMIYASDDIPEEIDQWSILAPANQTAWLNGDTGTGTPGWSTQPLPTNLGGTGLGGYTGAGRMLYSTDAATLTRLTPPILPGSYYLSYNVDINAPEWTTFPTAAGTVTSVALTAPNSNAILGGGPNPITTSGTIDINVGIPVFYDPVVRSLWINPSAPPAFISGFGGNFVITHQGVPNATTYERNVFLGNNPGNAITSGTSNIGIGSDALSSATQTLHNIGIGTGALQNLNGNAGNPAFASYNIGIGGQALSGVNGQIDDDSYNVVVGYQSFSSVVANDFNRNVSVGAQIAVGFNNSVTGSTFLGQGVCGDNNPGSMTDCTFLGSRSTVASDIVNNNATAVGTAAVVEDNDQVQLGNRCSVALQEHLGSPVVPATPRIALWLDSTANKLLRAVGDTESRSGGVFLINGGTTTGTVTISAGSNPISPIISSSVVRLNSVIILTVQEPANISDAISFFPTSITPGVSFRIRGNGNTTGNVTVGWAILNEA